MVILAYHKEACFHAWDGIAKGFRCDALLLAVNSLDGCEQMIVNQ